MQTYFDDKIWEDLTNFNNGLIGAEFSESICLPNTKTCKNKRVSRWPWKKSLPVERIYYIVSGVRQSEQHGDVFYLIVETDDRNIILDTKLGFQYDDINFMDRGIVPQYRDFLSVSKYFSVVKKYITNKKMNFDEATSLIDNGDLEFRPIPSSLNQRIYRDPGYSMGDSIETSSIEVRAGFGLDPNWPDYVRVSRNDDDLPILEYSINGSYWVSDPDGK